MGIGAPLGVAASGLPNLGDQCNAFIGGQITAVGPTAPFAFRGPLNLAIWASVNTTLTTTKGSLAASVASATGLAAGNAINSVNVPPGATVGALSSTNVTLALPPVTLPASKVSTASAAVTLPPGSNVATLVGAVVTVPSTAEQATLPAGTTVLEVLTADVAPSLNSPGKPGVVLLSNAPTTAPPNITPTVPLTFAVTGNAITKAGADAAATFTGNAVDYSATIQLERSFDGCSTWLVCNIGGSGALAQWSAGTPINLTFGEPEKLVYYRLNCTAYTSGTPSWRMSQTGGAAESLAIGPLTNG
jgi:hypothetical protein